MNESTWSPEKEVERFRPTYRQLSDAEKELSDNIKIQATRLSCMMQKVKGGAPSREKSLAITSPEESVMWAIKALTACLVVLSFANTSPAFASGNTCIGNANCSTTNNDNDPITNTNTAAGGSATNTNVITPIQSTNVDVDADYYNRIYNKPVQRTNVETNVDVKNKVDTTDVNINKVDVDTRDYNTNKQKQGQIQGQLQGQAQGQDQAQSQKIDDSGNSSIVWNEKRDVAQAYAGSAAIGSDVCMSSVGAGGQGPAFGFSFNFARNDETCELLKLSRRIGELGYQDGAVKLLCQDDRVAEALPQVCGKKD